MWGLGWHCRKGVVWAVATLLFGLSPLAHAAPVVWVAPSLQRVSPDDPPGTATQISLHAAQGESESFQIVVSAPAEGLTGVDVAASALADQGGRTFPPGRIALSWEHYVYLSQGSGDWSGNRNPPLGPGWYPDALIPFPQATEITNTGIATCDKGAVTASVTIRVVPDLNAWWAVAPATVAGGQNVVTWVDISVPRWQAPGTYQGTFFVISDQGSASVSVSLTVWDFTLPLQPALKSSIGLGADYLTRGTELLRNRLMPRHVDAGDERALIDTYGLNSANAGFWSGASQDWCVMVPPPSVSDLEAAAEAHQPDLFLYDYSADEIGSCTNLYDMIQEWGSNLHQTRIKHLITMAPVPQLYDDGSGTGRSAVDVWVVLPKMYDAARDAMNSVLAKGDEVWSYNALEQDDYSPKWAIDFAPINYRIQPGFLNQSLGLTGLLYWRADYWSADPWNDPSAMPGYPGEGLLLYPGSAVGLPGVVPSLRLKYLRDGVDDYDYIELLKKQGDGDWALGVVRGVAPDWSNWTRDPEALEAARVQLGERLSGWSGLDFRDIPLNFWAYREIHACYIDHLVVGYADDTYRPRQEVTRDQMSVYVARAIAGGDARVPTAPATPSFTDVPTDYWAYQYIEYCRQKHIVSGFPGGYFRPTGEVNRGSMAVFIARAIVDPTGDEGLKDYTPPKDPTYADVPPRSWFYRYVEYLSSQGVVHGYEDGSYRPGQTVTRDQLAVYLARAFDLL